MLCYKLEVAKLQISFAKGKRKGKTFSFAQAVVRVGRHTDNDLVLDTQYDRKVSGFHAEIRRYADRFILHDLQSTNGTFVEGARVEEDYALSNGENVVFGHSGPTLTIKIIGAAHDPHDPTSNIDMVPDIASTPSQPLDPPESPAEESMDGEPDVPDEEVEEVEEDEESSPLPLPKPPSKEHNRKSTEVDSPIPTSQGVPSGRTAFYRAMMLETIHRSRRPLILMIAALAVLLLVVSLMWFLYSNSQSDASNKQIEADQERILTLEKKAQILERKVLATERASRIIRKKLTQKTDALIALRERLRTTQGPSRKRLEEQAKKLELAHAELVEKLEAHQLEVANLKEETSAAEQIASTYGKALFMLIAKTKDGEQGYCTAFAIQRTGLLATNGHCALFASQLKINSLYSVARMNNSPQFTYRIESWKIHPEYNDTAFSADVALIQLDLRGEQLPIAVTLATKDEVLGLRTGQPIYTMGYPGKVMNPHQPSASLRTSVISRLSTYQKTPGNPREMRMVWHSALTSKGTSGSPIFNANGKVVAINNGGLGARKILSEDATGNKQVEIAYDATGLNFGVRVDTLHEVLPQ